MKRVRLGISTGLLLLLSCGSGDDRSGSVPPAPSGALDGVTEPEQPATPEQPTTSDLPSNAEPGDGNIDVDVEIPIDMQQPPTLPMEPAPGLACVPLPNPAAAVAGDVNVALTVEHQPISGFGGNSIRGWIPDLTPEQVDTAFGNGPGQLGLTLLRIRVPFNPATFALEVPTAARAVALGAKVMATPWSPPPALKTNNDPVDGELRVDAYGAYAEHLLGFRDFMAENGAPLYAISVQNEPDFDVDYESCLWTPAQLVDWIVGQGSRFVDTKLMTPESVRFERALTDPILENPVAAAEIDIVAGHIYGGGVADYPLARSLGKEVWMTEHYRNSDRPANEWPLALDVGKEIHDVMAANFSAYIWWYIRRSYGLLTEDGLVSKRGYLLAQYAKFIRPGFVRVDATPPSNPDVLVTAYKGGAGEVVIVAVNMNAEPQDIAVNVFDSCVVSFSRFTTSATKNIADDGALELASGRASITLDAQSVTTFVSR